MPDEKDVNYALFAFYQLLQQEVALSGEETLNGEQLSRLWRAYLGLHPDVRHNEELQEAILDKFFEKTGIDLMSAQYDMNLQYRVPDLNEVMRELNITGADRVETPDEFMITGWAETILGFFKSQWDDIVEWLNKIGLNAEKWALTPDECRDELETQMLDELNEILQKLVVGKEELTEEDMGDIAGSLMDMINAITDTYNIPLLLTYNPTALFAQFVSLLIPRSFWSVDFLTRLKEKIIDKAEQTAVELVDYLRAIDAHQAAVIMSMGIRNWATQQEELLKDRARQWAEQQMRNLIERQREQGVDNVSNEEINAEDEEWLRRILGRKVREKDYKIIKLAKMLQEKLEKYGGKLIKLSEFQEIWHTALREIDISPQDEEYYKQLMIDILHRQRKGGGRRYA